MKPLVVIPARGGSKGIPNKNIKVLQNKPLIEFTIDAALEVFNLEDIIISTDSEEIKTLVEKRGGHVPFLRPSHLATDSASTRDVLLHALEWMEEIGQNKDTIVLLQPTSPFRHSQHIRDAIEIFDQGIDMVVSVRESKANPYFNLFEENNLGYLAQSKPHHATRRQDLPKVWEYNGAIYVINKQSLLSKNINEFERVLKYVMDDVSSIDIDTPLDWEIAKMIARQMKDSNESD